MLTIKCFRISSKRSYKAWKLPLWSQNSTKIHRNEQKMTVKMADVAMNMSLVFMLFGVTAVRTACTPRKTKARKVCIQNNFIVFCRRLYYFLVPLLSDCPLAFFHAQASIIILFLILIYGGIVWAEVKDSASIARHMFGLLLWRKFLICLFDRTVRTEGKYELCGVLKYFSASNNEQIYFLILLFFQTQCLLVDSGTDRKENFTSGPAIFFAFSCPTVSASFQVS